MTGRAPSGQALAVPATPANAVDGPSGFDPSRWQAIETAPQGCMCLFADMTAMEARNWAFVDWRVNGQFCGDRRRTATHWIPLPTPPSDGGL